MVISKLAEQVNERNNVKSASVGQKISQTSANRAIILQMRLNISSVAKCYRE